MPILSLEDLGILKESGEQQSLLDCLAGKAISGVLVGSTLDRYQSVVAAANDLLTQNLYYKFSHKSSVDHKDVRMALIQAYY